MKIKPENLYLSEKEKAILIMLSEGKSYFLIRKHLQIVSSSFANTLASLRRKTGMPETHDPQTAQNYLNRCREAFESPEMTPEQEHIFRKVAEGHTLQGISYRLQRPESEVKEQFERALCLAGIFTSHFPTVRVQCRAFLAAQELRPGAMAPVEIELRVMRGVVTGKSYTEIAAHNKITKEYAKECFRKGCMRAQVTSRGRGSMVNLARIFLASLDARKAEAALVTMDDPAF